MAVELKAADCWAGHSARLAFEYRDAAGDSIERESESFRTDGTAVREELSEEKRLEPLVAEDMDDLILPWSRDFLGPVEESEVENES